MAVFEFIIGSLVTYRITRLIRRDDGPFAVVLRFRKRIGAEPPSVPKPGSFADLIACPKCLSLWIGLGVALATAAPKTVLSIGLWTLALSAAAIFITAAEDKYLDPPEKCTPPEEPDDFDGSQIGLA